MNSWWLWIDYFQGASNSMNVSKAFITIILLPLAENACATNFAIRNMLVSALKSKKIDFLYFFFFLFQFLLCWFICLQDKTLGVVVVSSTYILMFVVRLSNLNGLSLLILLIESVLTYQPRNVMKLQSLPSFIFL